MVSKKLARKTSAGTTTTTPQWFHTSFFFPFFSLILIVTYAETADQDNHDKTVALAFAVLTTAATVCGAAVTLLFGEPSIGKATSSVQDLFLLITQLPGDATARSSLRVTARGASHSQSIA